MIDDGDNLDLRGWICNLAVELVGYKMNGLGDQSTGERLRKYATVSGALQRLGRVLIQVGFSDLGFLVAFQYRGVK